MDRLKKYFDRRIIEYSLLFFLIYIVLYILRVDLHLIITAILFIGYFYYSFNNRENDKKIILTQKKQEPFENKLPSTLNNYDDIVNFLYYINDFKLYNDQVYNDLLINLNDFLTLYEDYSIIGIQEKKLMSDVIIDTKYKILDGLSSFIYSFNNSPILRNKLNDSVNLLNNILNNYIQKLNIDIPSVEPANNYL
jgi:hypothetical protein